MGKVCKMRNLGPTTLSGRASLEEVPAYGRHGELNQRRHSLSSSDRSFGFHSHLSDGLSRFLGQRRGRLRSLEHGHHRIDLAIVDLPDPTSYALGKLYTNTFYSMLAARVAESGFIAVPLDWFAS